MCLPGNTLAGRIAGQGIAAKLRDRVFGEGFSERMVGNVDKVASKATVMGRIKRRTGIADTYGFASGASLLGN
jgi:hypothetical protein